MANEYTSNIPGAPAAVGPYSVCVKSGELLFLSGQIALDPSSGEIVSGGVDAQTHQVMKNLKAVLAHYKLNFENVAKTTIFLTNMGDYKSVNAIYEQHLGDVKPARSTVQVAALPRAALVEIEMIASFR